MESIADTILKYDGYIWGSWVHHRVDPTVPEPKTIQCRFVSKNIFSETMPHQFIIDLKQNFDAVTIKGKEIRIGDLRVIVDIHGPMEELKFIEEIDFTCNLIDYRRTGLHLRSVPLIVSYDVCPFDTVVQHIRERKLVPVHPYYALKNFKSMEGWKCEQAGLFIGPLMSTDVCGVCHCEITDGVRTECKHEFHVDCMTKWLEKSATCPMCRERV